LFIPDLLVKNPRGLSFTSADNVPQEKTKSYQRFAGCRWEQTASAPENSGVDPVKFSSTIHGRAKKKKRPFRALFIVAAPGKRGGSQVRCLSVA
jgi:hypothetical protein